MKTLGSLMRGIGRGVVITGLGLLLMGNDDEACTPEEKMILGEMIAEQAAKEDDKFGEYTGKKLYLEGERERAERIARAGADRTNIYTGEEGRKEPIKIPANVIYSDGVYQPASGYKWLNNTAGDYRVRKIEETPVFREPERVLKREFFACNYWKDFNRNNMGDYPEEYVGIKNRFKDDEKIVLVSYDEIGRKGTKYEMKIYDPKGKEIHKIEGIYGNNGEMNRVGVNYDMMGWLVKKGGYGTFKAVQYLNNNYTGSSEFEIVPGSRYNEFEIVHFREEPIEESFFVPEEPIIIPREEFQEGIFFLEDEMFEIILDEDFIDIELDTSQINP